MDTFFILSAKEIFNQPLLSTKLIGVSGSDATYSWPTELLFISRILCVSYIRIKIATRKRYDIIKVSKKQEINVTDLGGVLWKHIKKALLWKGINDLWAGMRNTDYTFTWLWRICHKVPSPSYLLLLVSPEHQRFYRASGFSCKQPNTYITSWKKKKGRPKVFLQAP